MKLGVQSQGNIPEIERVLAKKPATWLLLGNALNLDVARRIRALSPNTLICLRWANDGDWAYRDGVWNARFVDNALRAFEPFQRLGLCDVALSPNEPVARNDAEARQLNGAQVYVAGEFRSRGYKVCGYNFSVGNPDFPLWPYLLDGVRACDYLGLHEYGAPRVLDGNGFWTLRYRKVWNLLPADARKPILITECGIDGGVIDGKLRGYKSFTNAADYLAQLGQYNAELEKDDYVVGAHLFGYGMLAPWVGYGFDVAEDDEDRAQFINWLGAGAPPPPPPPPPIPPKEKPPMQPIDPAVIAAVRSMGAVVEEGTPVAGRKYYRLIGFNYRDNVNATLNFRVSNKDNSDAFGVQVVDQRTDGRGEIQEADERGGVQFQLRASSIFTEPGQGVHSVFVTYGAVKDDDTKMVTYDGILSDRVRSLGDYLGLHREVHALFKEVDLDAPPSPTPATPTLADDEALRGHVASLLGVSYNPDAAFSKRARALGLGAPLKSEFRYVRNGVRHAAQPFMGGVLECVEGEWEKVRVVEY